MHTPGDGDCMTPRVVERWYRFMETGDEALLDDLLDEEVTFYSPAVFTPQAGRAKAAAYLIAAEKMFANTTFRYTGAWYREQSAILEFSADLDGIQIEGVDMIRWSDDETIVTFKVMVRPLRALHTTIRKMGDLLELPGAPIPCVPTDLAADRPASTPATLPGRRVNRHPSS